MAKTKQKLELNWIGKEKRPRLEPRILIEDQSLSYRADRPTPSSTDLFSDHSEAPEAQHENLLIQGDNLLALKALEREYAGKVKCVFIDPPYNTGSAFQHYDDGLEHSIWLSLMRDRLEIIRTLMSEDGSLWITIDDNEAHYLKVLCDEIFGRQNFVTNAIWHKKYTVANDAKWFSENHDHLLVFAKNKQLWRPNRLPRTPEMNARYSNPDNHPKGVWKATPIYAKRRGSEREQAFSITFKNGVTWRPPAGTSPRFPKDRLLEMDANDEIWFGANGESGPSRKTFLAELKDAGTPPATIWSYSDVGHNHEAREESKSFSPSDAFPTPKPERLMQRILHLATSEGSIVLDSFAGSGTTGAVAQKMGRRWIMVELGDHCETHIVPRIKKVIDNEDPRGITESVGWVGGGGYRFYRLAPSLLKQDHWGNWIINEAYDPEMLARAMCKQMGFDYCPSEKHFWIHGQSTESDFIYVTTGSLSYDQLKVISEEVGSARTLLICCKAFLSDSDDFENLTLKKIPNAVLKKCEWDQDDYSLNINVLPSENSEHPSGNS